MAIFYHGTSVLFDHFDMSHLFEGDGKCKFGVGEYATSVYSTAALYAGKGINPTYYVYTIEVLRNDVIRIVKIETVELDSKGKYVNGSNRTVKQYE